MSDFNNYTPISRLPDHEGNAIGNELLIISEYHNNDRSDAVSYSMPILAVAPCLSTEILEAMAAQILSAAKNLMYADKSQLEYDPRTSDSYELTSFSHKRLNDNLELTDASFLSDEWWAVSALHQNSNNEITNAEYIDLRDVSATALAGAKEYIKDLKLDKGIVISSLVGAAGVPLAQIDGKTAVQTIYSGDPAKLVNIVPNTNVGNKIADVAFGGTDISVELYNGLSVNTVNPSYNPGGYVGETIAYINGVELKNNVSVMLNSSGDRVIATINGHQLSNGVFLENLDTTGNQIATLNGNAIHNGVVVQKNTNVGRVACNIVGTDIYNNVNVDDFTNKLGGVIAEVNGKNIYNGISIEDEPSQYLTYITIKRPDGSTERHKVLAGIKLGSATQNTTTGDVIAKIETTDRVVPIYNGINTNDLSSNIVAKLEAEIEMLRAQHEADMQWIKNELKKYVLLNSGAATQTIVGPTTFSQRITGNITNADYAIRAQWS